MNWRSGFRKIVIGAAALFVALLIAVVVVVQTPWFDGYVRREIVSSTEEATGGKVGIEAFHFDLRHLRATVDGFVIHGTEPAGAAPFLRVAKAEADFRLLPSLGRLYEITYLGVTSPQVNVIQFADGSTNIPSPANKSPSNTTALQTVVDLAVLRFQLTNGLATVENRKTPFDLRGNNLSARLSYRPGNRSYSGQLSLQPIYVVFGRNTPVTFTLTLPVTLQGDRIDVRNGMIATSTSKIEFSGSVSDLRDPKISAQANGSLSLADVRKATPLHLPADMRGLPPDVTFSVDATASAKTIGVNNLQARWGQSALESSGTLKSPQGAESLGFQLQVALNPLSRLLDLSTKPEGLVRVDGNASLDAANNYVVSGKVEAGNLSFPDKELHIGGIRLDSAFHLTPRTLNLTDLRVGGFGGDFTGDAALQNFAQFQLNGNIHNLNLAEALHALGQKIPYNGMVSGQIGMKDNIEAPGVSGLSGQARLSVKSGHSGIPVNGQLNAKFIGSTGTISFTDTQIHLPHTNVTINGSTVDGQAPASFTHAGNIGPATKPAANRLDISLTSTNLDDLLAAASIKGPVPITLENGRLMFQGTVSGGLKSPRIAGIVSMVHFNVEGRPFDSLNADLSADSSRASVANAVLTRDSMRIHLAAAIGLKHWAAPPYENISADLSIGNGDLADILAIAGQRTNGFSGALNAAVQISGTLGNPQGAANMQVTNGTIFDEPFSQLQANVVLANQRIAIPAAYIQATAGRLNLTAEYNHPGDSLTPGELQAYLRSTPIDLGGLTQIDKRAPLSGAVRMDADVTADISGAGGPGFLLTGVNADLSGSALRLRGIDYGTLNATARTNAQTVTYNLKDNVSASSVSVSGNTKLARDYPTVADATLTNLPVDRLLVPIGQQNLPVHGDLSGTAHFDGTVTNPQGNIDLDLSHGAIYDEPIQNVRARASWLTRSLELSTLEIVSGPGTITLSGRYDHPAGDLQQGTAQFEVSSSPLALNRVRRIQKLIPGFGGAARIEMNGSAQIHGTAPRILLSSLNADITARNIQAPDGSGAPGASLGDFTFTAKTNNGAQLSFALDSDLAGSSIQGRGSAALTGDYPVNAQLTFANLSYKHLSPLLHTAFHTTGAPSGFDAATAGQVTLSGPALKPDQLRGSLELTRFVVTAAPPGTGKSVTISNQGPIAATLDRETIDIRSMHLTGPNFDIAAGGSASLAGQALDLTLNANADLSILPAFYPSIYSTGKIAIKATIQGSMSKPLIDGQLALNNAAVNYTDIPNGISKATGVIAFNGNNAIIRSLNAESGGGKVTLSGFVGYTNGLRFGIDANATNVRIGPQDGVSVTIAGGIRLTGTAESSTLAGTVTIDRFVYNPQSDIGSILSRATPEAASAGTSSSLLANMRLAIVVRSSAGVAVQASLAQNLQAAMDLQVRGTMAQPAVLGKITINEGKLVFFGVSYSVNNGTIGFYNPVRIEPVLNISLETQAQGVHVTVTVTGPIDDMKLSYTSDPPLQFQEIVALLAAGQTPTSDPTLLANQPQLPQQSFQQMGESALLTQTLANPVADRLQRVFGITQLKISPAFETGTELPTARLTVQQQVSSNLTFTYTSALDDPNGLIVTIEWAFSPQYSAVATRDQNGIFSLNFFYKRHFR